MYNDTDIFGNLLPGITVLFDFPEFSVNGFIFGNSVLSGFSENFPRKFPYHSSPFRHSRDFLLNF